MELSIFKPSQSNDVVNLFKQVFSVSENEIEGQNISELVSKLIGTTITQDLIGCVASSNSQIKGGIFFSRLFLPSNDVAFILSPVAIATDIQGKGIGQDLINYGLKYLKSLNVDLVFTYGDPKYYSKTGFIQISEHTVQAPLKLSQPEGWLAQALDGREIKTIKGSTRCVEALNDRKYW